MAVEFSQISANARHQLLLKCPALREERRQSQLHRRIHREKSVGDHFEPRERLFFHHLRPARREPRRFHLRQPANFRQAARREGQRALIPGIARRRFRAQKKIKKYFVRNQCQLARGTDGVQLLRFCTLRKMPGRIIGMHDDDPARPRRDRLLQCVKINLPAMVINQRVPHQLHVLDVRQKIKERITRRRSENFVAGIAQQAKHIRISFTSAGGENNVVHADGSAPFRVVFAHGLPCRNEAPWRWLVLERLRIAECVQDCTFVIGETAFRWIRHGQIHERLPRCAMLRQRFAQAVRRQIPLCAVSKHVLFNDGAGCFTKGKRACSRQALWLSRRKATEPMLGYRILNGA